MFLICIWFLQFVECDCDKILRFYSLKLIGFLFDRPFFNQVLCVLSTSFNINRYSLSDK